MNNNIILNVTLKKPGEYNTIVTDLLSTKRKEMKAVAGFGLLNPWEGTIAFPDNARLSKPRAKGLTMVMDKGLGLSETAELLSIAGEFIDYIKLAFGTSALYPGQILRDKVSLIRTWGIHVYPGGTFLEIAAIQHQIADFLEKCRDLGFSAIEVSDGTISLTPEERADIILMAKGMGYHVLSEVGKKSPMESPRVEEIVSQVNSDLIAGADHVILEARESGKGIGIFDEHGDIRNEFFRNLAHDLRDTSSIIWEAPLKNQQLELIRAFGPNVNLGNIPPGEALALEALRVGLRSDTLKDILRQQTPLALV